ncbi:helix-turn-helix domain-containing protein [Bosea sp. BIWAKO-01]|uniref:helix-turn-helix transcriptional regulator n=1 Tax=Bosea sp. BIWAKO-01 TaxID=506668 RepID=UPI00114CCF92
MSDLMTKADAAAYCGVCPATFTNWVASGVMPTPFRGTRMYDRRAIDAFIDRDSGILRATAPEEDAFDRWEREQREAKASAVPGEDSLERWLRENKNRPIENSYDEWQRKSLERRARKAARARAAAGKAPP